MPLALRLSVISASIILLLYVLHLVKQDKLQLRYALLWLTLATVILFCSVFPQLLVGVSAFFGFATLSNFIFLVGFFFLLIIALSLSLIVSQQSASIKNLTQRIALLEFEKNRQSEKPNYSDR